MSLPLRAHDRFFGPSRLNDPRLWRDLAYLDGKWQAADSLDGLEVTNPSGAALLGHVPAMGAAEVDRAVEAAGRAFPGWSALAPQDRSARLYAWHQAICAAKQDLAHIMVLEQGKPLAEALGEIDYAASFVLFYAEEAKRVNIESVTSHLPDAEMTLERRPIGVAALVTPWNFPSAMITRKAAAALAAGCSTVVFPSPETPFSALALAELAERAGIPAGVFNVVTGRPQEVGPALCSHPKVRIVSFTGSTEVGRLIAHQAADSMKRLIMELGGHAPFLVFADADLERAVDCAVSAKFATSGQDCLAANRILVQRPVYEAFLAAYGERVAALKLGDGLEPGVEIGPLMNEKALAKMEAQVADALEKGARLITGGRRVAPGSLFFQPTLLADVPADALIFREETFGPIAAVAAFDEEAEALARANDSEYGLCAYLHSGDAARCRRLASALDYGMVAVNRTKITGAPVPFGGVKQSGLGREGSRLGLEAYTEVKYICRDIA